MSILRSEIFAGAEDAMRSSRLPERPDREAVERLLAGMLEEDFEGSPRGAVRT